MHRILHSPSFGRSRIRAEHLDTDPLLLEEMLGLVRLRRLDEDEHLAPLADLVDQAVDWLSGSTADPGSSAADLARRRMTITALSYLVDFNDVIPDDVAGGTVDDHVVLDFVLSRALGPAGR